MVREVELEEISGCSPMCLFLETLEVEPSRTGKVSRVSIGLSRPGKSLGLDYLPTTFNPLKPLARDILPWLACSICSLHHFIMITLCSK